jgi:Methyltransferase domain
LLNHAARFFPILRKLQVHLARGGSLLEVGSGSVGLGEFWAGPFVGCDVMFPSTPIRNMFAVRCSGYQLPFADGAFDAVVVSDVMEHIPPPLRKQVVAEALRVSRKMAVFGYPCGQAAFELDKKLFLEYQSRKLPPPVWLEEHMLNPFPEEDLFTDLPTRWKKEVIPNESLRFHSWMMRTEMSRLGDLSLRLILKIMPALIERLLQRANGEPSYRKIFVLTCEPEVTRA